MEGKVNRWVDPVNVITDTYAMLSPLNATANRIIRRKNGMNSPLDFIEDGEKAVEVKTYTFRSTYDSVEVTRWSVKLTAFNVDGEIIEGFYTAHDSSIGSTRLFETYEDAAYFAGARKSSQNYLNGVLGA